MDEKQITRTTLLVDGSVLKKHMRKMGQEQNAQLIAQYLSHMVQTLRKEHPNGLVHIHYYGARLSDSVPKPISGEAHTEPEYKLALKHCHIPGALLKTSWGRAVCSAEQPWILKPECFNKDKLSDEDFVLNEH